ncbi:flagellar hook-associated protein FlgL [Planctomicrobium sp. SH661]|uniref:flagellar hook-associated protein FlgL n=1 Tax=Planctomicrobium sp. SH661 TaxID=3448124 RepID=UPI003F5B8AD1
MSFRVTPHRQYELGQSRSQTHYARGARLQEQISSGLRINKPSDDPSGQKVVLNQAALLRQFATQLGSVNTARSVLSDSQTQVKDAHQLIVKAKDIALQARQSTEPSERDVFVRQLDSILEQLDDIANSQSGGKYLFGGTQNGGQPFTGIVDGIPAYEGSSAAASISLPGHSDIKTYYTGSEVFQPATGGTLVISGTTGIASGSGTSSGASSTTLSIRHTLTTYSGTSGVQAGTSSVSGDTILGPAGTHRLTIKDTSGNGTAGTISLNGGPEISFTISDTDLLVTGPQGEKVYLDTRSISAGFQGTVDLTATGTLSIDGGTTEVPVDFSSSQVLTDPNQSVVQYFNTVNLRSTGTVNVSPAVTADVFQAVRHLKETIQNVQGLSNDDLDAAFNRSLQNLDAAGDHLLSVIGDQSVDLEHLETLESRIDTLKLNAETLLTDTQATDYATAITQLQEQQNLLQFTLQTLTVMNRISILDFL